MTHDPPATDIQSRLWRRLRQRYARWLLQHPDQGFCRSPGWRSFWRNFRRRRNAVLRTPAIYYGVMVLVTCLLLFIVTGLLLVAGILVFHLPKVFFFPPDSHQFVDGDERAVVALTRLTFYQSLAIPLILLASAYRDRSRLRPENRRFYRGRDRIPRLGWPIAMTVFLLSSLAVFIGATVGKNADAFEIAAASAFAVIVLSCVGWLILGLGRWLMGIRMPEPFSNPELQACVGVVVFVLTLAPACGLLYGSTVLPISRHLASLGPWGWLNQALLNGFEFSNFLWLSFFCAASVFAGWKLNRRANRWSTRRSLLKLYRQERPSHWRHQAAAVSRLTIARDIRQMLSTTDWQSWSRNYGPHWLSTRIPVLTLIGAALLGTQIIVVLVANFLAPLDEIRVVGTPHVKSVQVFPWTFAANMPGWGVLALETVLLFRRDLLKLGWFSQRPISAFEYWRDLQLNGLKSLPTYILVGLPFVIIPFALGSRYAAHSLAVLAAGLLSCVAARTMLTACGLCLAAMETLSKWIQAVLGYCILLPYSFLLIASVWPMCLTSPALGEVAVRALGIQFATLAAFALMWGLRTYLSKRPVRFLHVGWFSSAATR